MIKEICFCKTDKKKGEEDYHITFVPSGFKGIWIKVWELYDYTLGAVYASEEENKELNTIRKKLR